MRKLDKLVIGLIVALIVVIGVAGVIVSGSFRSASAAPGPGTKIVIDDPWCSQSEDSCTVDFLPNGKWVLHRIVP